MGRNKHADCAYTEFRRELPGSDSIPYSSCRGVFVDKFGIRWGIMTEQTEQ